MPLRVTVQDADTGSPIPDATIIYIASDIHDYLCKEGRVIRTRTDSGGKVDISGKWRFGVWLIAPGGLPMPQHIVAISAPGYSTYLFGRYDEMKSGKRRCHSHSDIVEALAEIPQENVIRDSRPMSVSQLNGEIIKLIRIK